MGKGTRSNFDWQLHAGDVGCAHSSLVHSAAPRRIGFVGASLVPEARATRARGYSLCHVEATILHGRSAARWFQAAVASVVPICFITAGMPAICPGDTSVERVRRIIRFLHSTAGGSRYWLIELATLENTLFAFPPISRIVPTTITRITASITAYSAMS